MNDSQPIINVEKSWWDKRALYELSSNGYHHYDTCKTNDSQPITYGETSRSYKHASLNLQSIAIIY